MASISRQIGWSQESNLLYQILNQLSRLTSTLFSLKEAATPKYKVYTALLTQSGGSDELGIQYGDLTIGVTYRIEETSPDSDWTNVGAPNNNVGTYFVATGTTPNSWGDPGNLRYNTGAPVVTVLENTIGNFNFQYKSPGSYKINSNENLFIQDKTWFNQIFFKKAGENDLEGELFYDGIDSISINTFYNGIPSDDVLGGDSYGNIEIRVYN